jgi:inosine-uridine nucleoside N-ribohydrolase
MSPEPVGRRAGGPMPVAIDTDPGVDDALALLLAFRAPEWRIEAVTTVAGNVPVDAGTRNVARILGVVRPGDPPRVGVGAPGPLARSLVSATHVHGEDGLGGLGQAAAPDGRPVFPEWPIRPYPGDAAELLVECARRWPGTLLVVALGPLTNLALAVARDPEALRRVRAVVAMGGSVAVGGNVTAAAEYNVFADPEAAARVVGAGLPLWLVPLDVTHQAVWSAARIARLAGATDPVVRFGHALAERGLALARAWGAEGIVMHDPLAVAVALDPTLVEAPMLPVAVETVGELTRGVTVVDRRPGRDVGPSGPACRVALRVDAARFLRVYEERLCHA